MLATAADKTLDRKAHDTALTDYIGTLAKVDDARRT